MADNERLRRIGMNSVDNYTDSPERREWLAGMGRSGSTSPTAQVAAGSLPKPRPGPAMIQSTMPASAPPPTRAAQPRPAATAPQPASRQPGIADRLRQIGFRNTVTAIQGAGENIQESYRAGGLPSAVGATVRNTMVPAIGFADDVMTAAGRALDPAAQALKTFATGDPTPINARSQAAQPAPQNAVRGGAATVSGQAPQPAEQVAPQTAAERLAQRFGGITRSVDANTGRVTFSGEGPAATQPQMTPAQRLEDMESSNDRLREIGLRSRELRDELSFNAGGALSRRIGPEERAQNMLSSSSRSDRQAALQYRLGQQQDATKRSELTATERMRQPEFQQAMLQLENERRIDGLRSEYMNTTDQRRRAQIVEEIRAMLGSGDQKYQIATAEEALDPANPMLGTRKTPYLIDGAGNVRAIGGAGGGVQAQQFEEGRTYVDANGNRAVFRNGKWEEIA